MLNVFSKEWDELKIVVHLKKTSTDEFIFNVSLTAIDGLFSSEAKKAKIERKILKTKTAIGKFHCFFIARTNARNIIRRA